MTLGIEGLSVGFGGIAALRGVSLAAAPGERVALVGPNGAGKTTLLDAIGGFVPPSGGTVRLGDLCLSGLAPDAVARAGVARVFQARCLCPRMTVLENVRAGRALDARPWLVLAGLEGRADDFAGALTPGEERRLELARALAGAPRLLLLDEPFGGLTAAETDAMTVLIERTTIPGRITVLVDHKLGVVTRLCPRVVVLHLGEKIFDGPSSALRADPRVQEAYLGTARAP
ncbi:MAG: ATP-binding cassette domain-containing protein [Candidatus Rokubacteria bacterium]|nr:ATP-binding cassette domain-containing protein [Candidatus Rokubacteria bacterium]